MLTKLSVGLVAPAIGFIFIYVFIKNTEKKKIISQLCIFAVICFPLGLFWSIRNAVLFDAPINFIPNETTGNLRYANSVLHRIFIPSIEELTSCMRLGSNQLNTDYNIVFETLRSAIVDEAILVIPNKQFDIALLCLYWISNLIFLLTTVLFFIVLKKDNKFFDSPLKIFMLGVNAVLIISYVSLCFKYPHNCTMNYRYIIPTIIFPCLAYAAFFSQIEDKRLKRLQYLSEVFIVFFAVLSVGLFLSCAN